MHASTRKSFTCISAFIIIILEVWEVCIWRGKDTLAPASAGKAAHGGLADPRPQSFDHRYSPGAEFWWVLPGCIQQKKQGSIHKKNKKLGIARQSRQVESVCVKHKTRWWPRLPLLRRQERHRLRAAVRSRALSRSLGHGL